MLPVKNRFPSLFLEEFFSKSSFLIFYNSLKKNNFFPKNLLFHSLYLWCWFLYLFIIFFEFFLTIFTRLISCFFIRTGIGPLVGIQYFSTGIKMEEFTRASIKNNRRRLRDEKPRKFLHFFLTKKSINTSMTDKDGQ